MKIQIKSLTQEEIQSLGVESWPIWTCEVSEFPWTYDETESCLILEGEVIVSTEDETVTIKQGDFVVFPKGLSCKWNVLKPIRKHYIFE